MLHAKVGVFEDHLLHRDTLRQTLEIYDHNVVVEVGTIDEAREIIPVLTPGIMDVAIIDGNLRPSVIDGEDGREVAGLLRATLGQILLIGYSGAGCVEGVDIDTGKDIRGVVKAIEQYSQ